jgi:hypothetical protein
MVKGDIRGVGKQLDLWVEQWKVLVKNLHKVGVPGTAEGTGPEVELELSELLLGNLTQGR